MPRAKLTILSLIAGAVFLVGLALAVGVLIVYPSRKQTYQRILKTQYKLDQLEKEYAELDACIRPVEAISGGKPPDIEKLVRTVFSDQNVVAVEVGADEQVASRKITRHEIRLKNTELRTLPGFIRMLELLRPPVRLTRCAIKAGNAGSGKGDVVLEFEGISEID